MRSRMQLLDGFPSRLDPPSAEFGAGFDFLLDFSQDKHLVNGTVYSGLTNLIASSDASFARAGVGTAETNAGVIETFAAVFPSDNENSFINTEASYVFQNSDNPAFPTLGMKFLMQFGYTHNLDNSNGFGYLIPSLDFAYRLVPSGALVFATKSKAHLNFGDDFEFYQAASIGGNDGMRG
ncbi:MAG: phosphoesterase, partial [Micavibrio sp.]|nr:phosphoesterase [Micavibrio sp.]